MLKIRAYLLFALLASVVAFAQSTTSVRGHITDASGAVVPHASMKLTQVSTGATREGTSNAEGIYEFPQLQPGDAQIIRFHSVERRDFAAQHMKFSAKSAGFFHAENIHRAFDHADERTIAARIFIGRPGR